MFPINGDPATGSLPTGDVDFYQITNTEGFSAIEIHYIFSGSGNDTHRLTVQGPNGATELFNQLTSTGSSRYQATYTIVDGPQNANYFISVKKGTADGTLPYTLTVRGSFATINTASKSVAQSGETYNIEVSSATSWEVIDVPAWVTLTPASGTGNQTLTVQVAENPFLAREAVINIGGVFHTLTQAGNPGVTENEPTDNTFSGATIMQLNSVAAGSISNSDDDFYSFTKTGGPAFITVELHFNGSGPDKHRMRVLGPNGFTELFNESTGTSGDLQYRAIAEINYSLDFDTTYIVQVEGESSDGSKTYTLTVTALSTSIDPATRTVSADAGSYGIEVVSNTNWNVTGLPTWASASPESGSGVDSVTISYDTNTESTSREATFMIGGQSHVLTQEGVTTGTPTTTIDPISTILTGAGTSFTIDVTSNTTWTVTGLPAWATISAENGTGDITLTVTVQTNTGTTVRVAELTIGGQIHTLTQGAFSATPSTQIDTPAVILEAVASKYTLVVISNTSWSVTGQPEWLTLSPASGTNSAELTVSVSANTLAEPRSATLAIGGQSHSITQAKRFSLSELLVAVDAGGGAFYSSWFLFYFPQSDTSRWIFHDQLGWVYLAGETSDAMWYYDLLTNTFWFTNDTFYPSSFRNSDKTWYYLTERSTDGSRVFYNNTLGTTETLGNIFQ